MSLDRVSLTRFVYDPEHTLGLLRWRDFEHAYTVEDGWRDNRPNVSCIPDGIYRVVPRRFNKGGYDAWEILDVPGRDQIKIHAANTALDVQGCIAPGDRIAAFGELLGVERSKAAFERLYAALGGREFTLEIRPEPPLRGTAPIFVQPAGTEPARA